MNKYFTTVKLRLKRSMRFCLRGGFTYSTFSGLVDAVYWRLSNYLKPNSTKKIIWLGPFSPIHTNVGDHAQTLSVWNFLREKFSDYKIIRIYRDDISIERLSRTAALLNAGDFVFLHSSGDFGSMHDVRSHHLDRLSFPEIRRWVAQNIPENSIINLPVTAFYEDNQKGRISLEKDRDTLKGDNLTVLCREDESLRVLKDNLLCKSRFFPDFVFYLQPTPISIQRAGVLLILRKDREAVLSSGQKEKLVHELETMFSDVVSNDILHESFVIPDYILEKYIGKVFEQYQERELIITDKMHGMIMAVISQTPCIALQGGIPHKISAYKAFLSGAVEFVDDVDEIAQAIQRIRASEYKPVDLSDYFMRFRKEVAGL